MTSVGEHPAMPAPVRYRRLWDGLDRYGVPLALAVAVVVAWELGVRLAHVPAYLLPPPTAVLMAPSAKSR